jgi:hypothetical protein
MAGVDVCAEIERIEISTERRRINTMLQFKFILFFTSVIYSLQITSVLQPNESETKYAPML